MSNERLLEAIEHSMQPLLDQYALYVSAHESRPGYGMKRFENETTALQVAVDWREFRPFLSVSRIGGENAPAMVVDRQVSRPGRDSFDLDDLLILRKADPTPVGKLLPNRELEPVRGLLAEYVAAIEAHASDVLRGDFSIFVELERVVAERMRKVQP